VKLILEWYLYNNKYPAMPVSDLELWILRNPMLYVSAGKFTSKDVTGNGNIASLFNSETDLTGTTKLTEVTRMNETATAEIIAIDLTLQYPFFTDGVSASRDLYVGDFPADYVFNMSDTLFAKIDSGGISNVMLFKTARTASTTPTLAYVEAYLRGGLVYTGTYKTDQDGRPLLNDQGGLIFY